MKTIKTILALSLAIFMLCSCSSNEISPANSNIDKIESTTTKTDKKTEPNILDTIEKTKPNILDTIKKDRDICDEKALDFILEILNGPEDINILIVTPVEITKGSIGTENISFDDECYMAEYLFKIVDNLTGKEIPEYIEVKSYIGGVFEIGEEYLISPAHNYSALWDSYHLDGLIDAITRENLSDSDLDRINQAIKDRQKQNQSNNENKVIEKASLNKEFIKKVDLAVVITVKAKEKEEKANNVFDVTDYEIVEVLSGKEHEYLLHFGESLRLNTDVEVGGTYLVMLEVFEDSWVLPVARSGAVVSEKDEDFAKYKDAFLKVN